MSAKVVAAMLHVATNPEARRAGNVAGRRSVLHFLAGILEIRDEGKSEIRKKFELRNDQNGNGFELSPLPVIWLHRKLSRARDLLSELLRASDFEFPVPAGDAPALQSLL
jgi:hypothetical protein